MGRWSGGVKPKPKSKTESLPAGHEVRADRLDAIFGIWIKTARISAGCGSWLVWLYPSGVGGFVLPAMISFDTYPSTFGYSGAVGDILNTSCFLCSPM